MNMRAVNKEENENLTAFSSVKKEGESSVLSETGREM